MPSGPPTHRMVDGVAVPLSQEEIDAIQAEWDAWDAGAGDRATADNLAQRTNAVAAVSDLKAENKLLRAALLTALDEINTLRTWTRDFKAATAAATNLANFQTRVAALTTLNDRTKAQAITAITDKLNSGTADDAN